MYHEYESVYESGSNAFELLCHRISREFSMHSVNLKQFKAFKAPYPLTTLAPRLTAHVPRLQPPPCSKDLEKWRKGNTRKHRT